VRVEPLSAGHRSIRAAFDCGVESLNAYLRQKAAQDVKRKLAAAFVLVDDAGTSILGYYTLSSLSISLPELPAEIARRLPRYPQIPVALLGRLAVSKECHGQGLGEHLLIDALRRARKASEVVASFAVVVEAKDARAAEFYKRYGFEELRGQPVRLFLPMKTIEEVLG